MSDPIKSRRKNDYLAIAKERIIGQVTGIDQGSLVSRHSNGYIYDAHPSYPCEGVAYETKGQGYKIVVDFNHVVGFYLPNVQESDNGAIAYALNKSTLTLIKNTCVVGRIIGVDERNHRAFVHITLESTGGVLDILTTKGDILTHDGIDYVRLPVGTNDYVLTADSSAAYGIKWDNSLNQDIQDLQNAQGYKQIFFGSDWKWKQGTWEYYTSDSSYYHNQSQDDGDYLEFQGNFWEGSYCYTLVANKFNTAPIVKIYINDVLYITEDLYNLTLINDTEYKDTITLPSIKTRVKVKILIDGKNPSSPGDKYELRIRHLIFERCLPS